MDRDKMYQCPGLETRSHSDSETIDYSDYPPQVDFKDDVVFFGPITKRELLKSVEIEEEIVRRRIAVKKAKAMERRNVDTDMTKGKENIGDELNRTFDVLDPSDNVERTSEVFEPVKQPARCIEKRVLNDVTQLHQNREETRLLDLTVELSTTSVKPKNRKSNKYLLDETIMFNKSLIGASLPTPLPEKMSKSKNMVSTRKQLDVASKENRAENTEGTPRLVRLSDTFITDLIGENVLNATIPEDADHTPQIVETANTPDIFKRKQNRIWEDSPETKQQVKTRLVKESPAAKSSKFFFPKSPAVTVGTKLPVKTKTPTRGPSLFLRSPAVTKARPPVLLKSPATTKIPSSVQLKSSTTIEVPSSGGARDRKPLFPKSPVAAYIHQGVTVQSMSKPRHSACIHEVNDKYSKSDHKIDMKCKIPVPMTGMARRKLTLED